MDWRRARTVGAPVAPLLVHVALIASLQMCGEEPARAPAPAIARGTDRYTVAWMRPARRGGALVVEQFARDTLTSLGPPRVVVEREDLREGGVELVAIDGGYVVTTRIEDPEKRPSWATQILTVRLDRDGQPVGAPHAHFLLDRACHGAGVIGDRVAMAYKQLGRSHRHPDDVLGVLAVDREGGYAGDHAIAFNPIQCASAVRGPEIAIAWTRWEARGADGYAAGLRIAFDELRRGGRHARFAVPVGDVDPRTVRIAPRGDDWAILYGAPDRRLHVAFVDRAGSLLGTRALPRAIDAETADLATTERGLFVSWVDGGRVRWHGLDGSSRALKGAGARPGTTRALGDGPRCVVAWTTGAGKRARIASSAACP